MPKTASNNTDFFRDTFNYSNGSKPEMKFTLFTSIGDITVTEQPAWLADINLLPVWTQKGTLPSL